MVGGLTVSGIMKPTILTLITAVLISGPAFAQDRLPKPDCEDGILALIVPEGGKSPYYQCNQIGKNVPETLTPDVDQLVEADTPEDAEDDAKEKAKGPDYSKLTPNAERQARLDEIFKRLQAEENPEDANLIAEEIWALWLDSGSPSIDFVLRRGSAAHTRKDFDLARRMFDHVTELSPEYAEGWARSSRLALDEKDLGRALNEAAQALVLEPRHFFALWTMGNVFEQLGRQDEALEAYREAHKLYPELKAVKDRLGVMQSAIDGDVL